MNAVKERDRARGTSVDGSRPKTIQPGETVQEFAARMLELHGPPPQRVVDMVHDLQRQHAEKHPA